MVRFTAALAVLAVLIVASLAWAAEAPPKKKGSEGPERGSVTSLAIRDNTIRLRDFSGPVRKLVRRRGAADEESDDGFGGDSGSDGLDGADGQDGENGVSAYEVVTQESLPAQAAEPVKTVNVECPPGKVVTGGGAVPTPNDGAQIIFSAPQDDSTGWQASAARATVPWTLKVQAICAAVDP